VKKPNFFIIGAPKCGTTSLASWLSEHPNIYISPIKEPMFFCPENDPHRARSNMSDYEYLFRHAGEQHIAVGEASTFYLLSQTAVTNIENTYSKARYIIMLRNPINMAYSWHEQNVSMGSEHVTDFESAWRLSPERRCGRKTAFWIPYPQKLDYMKMCSLGAHLERFFKIIPRDRALVLILDDIKQDARREYFKVLKFLGVPDDERKIFPVKNPAKQARSRGIRDFLQFVIFEYRTLRRLLKIPAYKTTGVLKFVAKNNTYSRPRPPMSKKLRQELGEFFTDDIKKLEKLLSRDFSHWLRQE